MKEKCDDRGDETKEMLIIVIQRRRSFASICFCIIVDIGYEMIIGYEIKTLGNLNSI